MPTIYSPPRGSTFWGLWPIYEVGVQRDHYPLLNACIHYDLSDVQLLANLTQTYKSNASIDAEIRYVFPLPPDASVCSFEAVIDGERRIKGLIKEKAKAKATYDQAIAQGKTAALLEQSNVEIFQVSLGNIKPTQTIEVHISFVSVISHDGSFDSLRLTFPSTIAPRYGTPPSGMFGSSSLSHSKNTLDFSVAVEMTSHIKSITSPSHPIAMKLGESTLEPAEEFDPKKARVTLSSPALLEKDIVLVLCCQALDKPRCIVESFSPEEGGQEYTDAYALTLVPRFELPSLPTQEYIFLVDRSGSMGGGKMDAVRSALQILLMSLPSRGSYFNIISFGSRHTSLWPSSATYSADSVKAASAHVDSMTANYGGTEIKIAIEAAFASRVARPNSEIMSSAVFILTDGEAYDLDGVRSVIQDTVAKAKGEGLLLRTFCMGIGNTVSKAMCDTIARAGQGTTAFVGEEEKPDQKLMGLLRAARGAVVEDISIDWGVGDDDGFDTQDFEMVSAQDSLPEPPKYAAPISLFDESSTASSETVSLGPQTEPVNLPPPPRVQQAPSTKSLPPLYPGFRTSLFAIVRRGSAGNTAPSKTVRIKGSVLGRPVVLEVPVSQISKPTAQKPTQTKMIHFLAARALIQSIEDQVATGLSDANKAQILRLAERYGLASSQTSFVAVDELSEVSQSSAEYLGGAAQFSRANLAPPPAQRVMIGSSQLPLLARPTGLAFGSATGFGGGGSGRGGSGRGGFGSRAPQQMQQQQQRSQVPLDQGRGRERERERDRAQMRQELMSSGFVHTAGGPPSAPPAKTYSPTIETFARAQSFDGSFSGSSGLLQLLVRQPQALAVPATWGATDTLKESVWYTLLCVAYLETKFPDDKDVWEILVEKAMQFVEGALSMTGGDNVLEKVKVLKRDALKCIV